jgi:hypothetical protein
MFMPIIMKPTTGDWFAKRSCGLEVCPDLLKIGLLK